jgi:outer membrane protein assembly factor BamB
MTNPHTDTNHPPNALRLRPGVVLLMMLWLSWFVVPLLTPDALLIGMVGGLAAAVGIVVWWLFFSRARWSERLGAIAVMIAAAIATAPFLDKSIQNGMMGLMFRIYVIPGLCLALVAGAVAGRRLSATSRFAVTAAAIVVACGFWTLLRTDGVRLGRADLAWRWSPTAEERLLSQRGDVPSLPPASAETRTSEVAREKTSEVASSVAPAERKTAEVASGRAAVPPATVKDSEWPGFRGPNRDSVIRGVRIETDWSTSPPAELWRRPIGPGWSSFAVHGDVFYTQEQRGDEEIVASYSLRTGLPVWMHRDKTRFWESNGGAGPRGTPTLSRGRVYTFGATGILNALEASTGAVVWSRNVATDAEKQVPMWGFASSPLAHDDLVIVAASGKLVAYDIASGTPRWFGPNHRGSYSSPHRAMLGGVAQIMLLSADGATSVLPADGTLLWEHAWPESTTIVQPALLADGDVLVNAIAATGGLGLRRIAVKQGAHDSTPGRTGGWTAEERWTSTGLKPYFNDFVVHNGHAFGFDGSILSCINLADGKRAWKGGRYGQGQLVLLADQDVLLVLSEDGELALVSATPGEFKELARFSVMEGKTWNHPVLVGDVLLVRNGEEMVALRLARAGR